MSSSFPAGMVLPPRVLHWLPVIIDFHLGVSHPALHPGKCHQCPWKSHGMAHGDLLSSARAWPHPRVPRVSLGHGHPVLQGQLPWPHTLAPGCCATGAPRRTGSSLAPLFHCPPTATVVPRDQLSPRTCVPWQHCHSVVTCTPSKRPRGSAEGQLVWGSQDLQQEWQYQWQRQILPRQWGLKNQLENGRTGLSLPCPATTEMSLPAGHLFLPEPPKRGLGALQALGEQDGEQGLGSHAGRLLLPLLADRLFYIKAGGGICCSRWYFNGQAGSWSLGEACFTLFGVVTNKFN